jgi:hypothetical protein
MMPVLSRDVTASARISNEAEACRRGGSLSPGNLLRAMLHYVRCNQGRVVGKKEMHDRL